VAGLVTVHGKAVSADRMPLPPDAGAAVAAYLRDGRPRAAWTGTFSTTSLSARAAG